MNEEKLSNISELIELVVDFGLEFAKIINKKNITEEDVQQLKTKIKNNPEDYFPNLKK